MLLYRPIDDSKILLCYDNVALASAGATAEAAAISDKMPAARLVDGNPATLWTSTEIMPTGTRPRVDTEKTIILRFAKATRVSFVALGHHNCRVPWRVQFYAGEPELAEPVADSGWYDPIVRADVDELSFADFRFDLGPDPDLLAQLTATTRLHSAIELANKVECSALKISFDVSGRANGLANSISVSTVIVGNCWRPQFNLLKGWSLGVDDPTELVAAHNGQKFGVARPGATELSFALGWLKRGSRDEARELFELWFRKSGKKALVWCWPEPDNLSSFYASAGVWRLEAIPPITMAHLGLAEAKGFKLCECL